MTRTFLRTCLVALLAAPILITPAQAGKKERDFLKKLFIPSIPIPGKKKYVDVHAIARKVRLPKPPTPRISIPRPRIIVPPRPRIVVPRTPRVVVVKPRVRPSVSVTATRRRPHHHQRHGHTQQVVHQTQTHTHRCQHSTHHLPPCRKVEVMSVRPSRSHVWIPGRWQRHCCGWEWINGHWDVPPTTASVWVNGTWVKGTHGWHWMGGTWTSRTCY